MQYLIFSLWALIFLVSCQEGAEPTATVDEREETVGELQKRYAPDRRTDRVEVTLTPGSGRDTLSGYTTVPAAARALDSLAKANDLVERVRLLPQEGTDNGYGLIRVSVANIRTRPGHSQELTSQALLGTPVELLDQEDGWYLIRTPDRYIAWLETGAIVGVDRAELDSWFSEELRTCVPAQSVVMREPGGQSIVSELVAGNLLQATGTQQGAHTQVQLPDGRTGWVESSDLAPYKALATPEGLAVEELLTTAYQQAGRPYLWGGTSAKAMDCSGFTKTAYYLNGYVIPRDASQQVHAGVDVPLDDDFSQLQRGDLLFFGNYRDDGSERTTHVGFYLGEGRFLHAGADNGYITENSLLEGEEDYAAHRRESLLRARRLAVGTPGVVPIDTAFRSLYTRSSSR